LKSVLELTDDPSYDLLALANALFADEQMAAARDNARADHPHVEIVNVEHAPDTTNGGNHGGHVCAGWRSLEKDRRAVAADLVAAP